MKQLSSVVGLVVALLATPALAGIGDGPLPELVAGKKTFHLYSVPGVIEGGGLGTYFSCTSTDTMGMPAIQVGVEVFPAPGGGAANDPVATSVSVGPGATVIFGTSSAVGIPIDSNLGAGPFSRGSARILATSKKLACMAFIADSGNAPPTSMVYLTIVKKTSQKGE